MVLLAAPAWAQATARLSGTVRDQSRGVLPGVTVTATQSDTGIARTVVTDGSGAYVMPNLVLAGSAVNTGASSHPRTVLRSSS